MKAVDIQNFEDLIPCKDVSCEHVSGIGMVERDLTRSLFGKSSCCKNLNNRVNVSTVFRFQANYDFLGGRSIAGGVFNFMRTSYPHATLSCGSYLPEYQNHSIYIAELVQRVAFQDHFQDAIVTATKENGRWRLRSQKGTVFLTDTVIFANGGLGTALTEDELDALSLDSVQASVHSPFNSRLLIDTANTYNWQMGAFDAWYVDHVDSNAKWFLWEDRATVLALGANRKWELVYDESLSYNERGHAAAKKGIKRALYIYASASGESLEGALLKLDPPLTGNVSLHAANMHSSIKMNTVPKQCDSSSKWFWRNFPGQCNLRYAGYPPGPLVSRKECSMRIQPDDNVEAKWIYTGIIDTTFGPRTGHDARILNEENAYACGNAASAQLSHRYLSPGSTLANTLLTGYTSAKSACAHLT
jgi:hypothetical protein